ncbi:MAG: hypothetical protein NVSMB24_10760 [Mucilaginibacter sp.]
MSKVFHLALFLSLFVLTCQAQNTDTVKHKKPTLKFGLTYNSNSVYLGRTDSVTIPVYNLGATYTLKNGIFFSGTVNYVPSREFDKLDGGAIETGYNFEHDNLSGGITVSKYFSSFNSTQLISALDAVIGAELSYNLFDVITPSAHIDYVLGNGGGNDLILTGGIAHDFTIAKPFAAHDQLSIEPAIHFNAGSQNFYNTYVIRKQKSETARKNFRSKGKGNGNVVTTTSTQVTTGTTNFNKFEVLAYEFNLPFTYTVKKFAVEVNPVYAIAVHKIDDNGTNTFYVPNTSVFYLQLAVSYTF